MPVIVKGINAEDAELALEHGETHCGFQPRRRHSTTPSQLDVLPEVVAVVRGRAPIIVDGAYARYGYSLSLALGADAVATGRMTRGARRGGEPALERMPKS